MVCVSYSGYEHSLATLILFSWRFGAAWAGVTQPQVGAALERLEGLGVIERAGLLVCFGKPTPLWVPAGTREVT
jgi:hypothetical protein